MSNQISMSSDEVRKKNRPNYSQLLLGVGKRGGGWTVASFCRLPGGNYRVFPQSNPPHGGGSHVKDLRRVGTAPIPFRLRGRKGLSARRQIGQRRSPQRCSARRSRCTMAPESLRCSRYVSLRASQPPAPRLKKLARREPRALNPQPRRMGRRSRAGRAAARTTARRCSRCCQRGVRAALAVHPGADVGHVTDSDTLKNGRPTYCTTRS